VPSERALRLLKLGMFADRVARAASKVTAADALEADVRPSRLDTLRTSLRAARAELDRVERLLDARGRLPA
jgi:hypothetical protein